MKQLASQLMIGTGLKGARRSIQVHLVIGLAVVVVLAGGLGGWASTAEISGALIAPGQIVVETNVKKVQHPTGGVVGELLTRDGDKVKAGQIVVRLDDTVTKANLAIVTKNLDAALARAARLQAEQRGLEGITFPPQLTDRDRDPDVATVMASESKLFEVRVNGRAGRPGPPGCSRNRPSRRWTMPLLIPPPASHTVKQPRVVVAAEAPRPGSPARRPSGRTRRPRSPASRRAGRAVFRSCEQRRERAGRCALPGA